MARFNHKSVEEINILASAKFTAFTYQIPESMGEVVGSKKIVKAGTVFPANDATAIGLLLKDVDVTDGDREGSVVVEGIFLAERLPVAIDALAKPVLTKISTKEVI